MTDSSVIDTSTNRSLSPSYSPTELIFNEAITPPGEERKLFKVLKQYERPKILKTSCPILSKSNGALPSIQKTRHCEYYKKETKESVKHTSTEQLNNSIENYPSHSEDTSESFTDPLDLILLKVKHKRPSQKYSEQLCENKLMTTIFRDCSNTKKYSKMRQVKDNHAVHHGCLELHDWAVVFSHKLVFIEGNIRKEDSFRLYRTSAVEKVTACGRTVYTSSGSSYKLVGDMLVQASIDAGVPSEIALKFMKGFPKDWKTYPRFHRPIELRPVPPVLRPGKKLTSVTKTRPMCKPVPYKAASPLKNGKTAENAVTCVVATPGKRTGAVSKPGMESLLKHDELADFCSISSNDKTATPDETSAITKRNIVQQHDQDSASIVKRVSENMSLCSKLQPGNKRIVEIENNLSIQTGVVVEVLTLSQKTGEINLRKRKFRNVRNRAAQIGLNATGISQCTRSKNPRRNDSTSENLLSVKISQQDCSKRKPIQRTRSGRMILKPKAWDQRLYDVRSSSCEMPPKRKPKSDSVVNEKSAVEGRSGTSDRKTRQIAGKPKQPSAEGGKKSMKPKSMSKMKAKDESKSGRRRNSRKSSARSKDATMLCARECFVRLSPLKKNQLRQYSLRTRSAKLSKGSSYGALDAMETPTEEDTGLKSQKKTRKNTRISQAPNKLPKEVVSVCRPTRKRKNTRRDNEAQPVSKKKLPQRKDNPIKMKPSKVSAPPKVAWSSSRKGQLRKLVYQDMTWDDIGERMNAPPEECEEVYESMSTKRKRTKSAKNADASGAMVTAKRGTMKHREQMRLYLDNVAERPNSEKQDIFHGQHEDASSQNFFKEMCNEDNFVPVTPTSRPPWESSCTTPAWFKTPNGPSDVPDIFNSKTPTALKETWFQGSQAHKDEAAKKEADRVILQLGKKMAKGVLHLPKTGKISTQMLKNGVRDLSMDLQAVSGNSDLSCEDSEEDCDEYFDMDKE